MSRARPFGWRPGVTIRVRLAVAVALALSPVLLIAAAQTSIAFGADAALRRQALVTAAERSASTARARIEAAGVLLNTLGPRTTGLECAQRLADVSARLTGYANLIRFDRLGRVACAAATAPPDPDRATRAWFAALRDGKTLTAALSPGAAYAAEPALLAARRAEDQGGAFDGALAAVIPLSSLRPEKADRSLPMNAEVALADREGHIFSRTAAGAFPAPPPAWASQAAREGGVSWTAKDEAGHEREMAASPLVGDEVFVVLSTPAQGLFTWARLSPISRIILPLMAFGLALAAVMFVTERAVVRWISYLQRVAAIYARGRFTVRPLQAERAPPEIRDLAATLDTMAGAIVLRDASLHDSLAQKDGLMREIHHRVKNNLQVISSLLNLQQRALDDPVARAAMSDTRQRITALALVYRALYQGPDLKRVDLGPFLEELTAQLFSGGGANVRTEVHADPLIIDPDRLAPLALFAVEAISNAQKHAFAEHGGRLDVEFHVRGAEAELVIADDGGGSASDSASAPPSGVGATLMTAFARQLRGAVRFDRPASGGLRASLVFPTPDPAPGT